MTEDTHRVSLEVDRDLQYRVKRVARKLGLSLPDYWRAKLLEYAEGPIPDTPAPTRRAPTPKLSNRFDVPEEAYLRAHRRRYAEGYGGLAAALSELALQDVEQLERDR
jgi:hypothetical protein